MCVSRNATKNMYIIILLLACPLMILSKLYPSSPQDISCYNKTCFAECSAEHPKSLPIINRFFNRPRNTIFFIETSCAGGLQSKYACAVESAATANPNWHVIVLFAGPLKTEFLHSNTFQMLRSIPNLYFFRINSTDLALETPLEEIFVENLLAASKYPVVHAADLLRILILYLFGGVYLDLDMIVMRSFDTLPRNFIAREDFKNIASGIIAVTKNDIGRNFINIAMRKVADLYDGNQYAESLHEINIQTLEEMCITQRVLLMGAEYCQGFHVLEPKLFYPVHYHQWEEYYRKGGTPASMDDEIFTHHVWNSIGRQVHLEPDSFFSKLAEAYCPQTYGLYKDNFGQ